MTLHESTTAFASTSHPELLSLQRFLATAISARQELLWDCYLSGQLSDAGLENEISNDRTFATFVAALRQRH